MHTAYSRSCEHIQSNNWKRKKNVINFSIEHNHWEERIAQVQLWIVRNANWQCLGNKAVAVRSFRFHWKHKTCRKYTLLPQSRWIEPMKIINRNICYSVRYWLLANCARTQALLMCMEEYFTKLSSYRCAPFVCIEACYTHSNRICIVWNIGHRVESLIRSIDLNVKLHRFSRE